MKKVIVVFYKKRNESIIKYKMESAKCNTLGISPFNL